MFKTHLFFAFFVSLLTYYFFKLNPILYILILVFSATLPDIDHSKSWIGRKIPLLSKLINFIFGHRKLIHSMFFAIGVSLLILGIFRWYVIPFLIGYATHLALDGMTRQGVYPFYPIKFKLSWFIKTNGIVEKLFLVFLMLVSFIYLFTYVL